MMLNKVDVSPIVQDHLKTLRSNGFGAKLSAADLVLFFGIPSLAGCAVLYSGFRFRVDAVNGVLNVFALLTGLLLNFLVLVLSLLNVRPPSHVMPERRLALIREIFANVCFATLTAVVVVCLALTALSYMRSLPGATTGPVTTFCLIALTSNFVLTLLMVLKRISSLIGKEIQHGSGDASRKSRAA